MLSIVTRGARFFLLAWALKRFAHVETIGFDYGQRHQAELEAAQRIARQLGAVEHRVMKIDLAGIGPQQPGQHAQQRGLAGSVGAEDGEHLAVGHRRLRRVAVAGDAGGRIDRLGLRQHRELGRGGHHLGLPVGALRGVADDAVARLDARAAAVESGARFEN